MSRELGNETNSIVDPYSFFTGQYSFDKFEVWRKRKAIEMNYPELLQHKKQNKWSLVRIVNLSLFNLTSNFRKIFNHGG